MELGIVGFPKAGRTTIFNALTRAQAETAAYGRGVSKPNLGVAKVPDPRLHELSRLFQPERVVPAEVTFVDPPDAGHEGKTAGLTGEVSNLLQRADGILHVVRAFKDLAIPYPLGEVDPARDVQAMDMELGFADLAILEHRMQRLETSLKGAKPQERSQYLKEKELVARIKGELEKEIPLREQHLTPEEARALEHHQFLTAKPLLMVLNGGEEDVPDLQRLEEELRSRLARPGKEFVALCGKLEMELAQMPEAEEQEFRRSLGVGRSGREKVVQASYRLLGLVSFFTVVSKEVRAWSVPRDTPAVKAAGKIHSDMERGFIRAEVIASPDLVRCGGLAQARKQGLLRSEGKSYPVRDGDVITFLFNV